MARWIAGTVGVVLAVSGMLAERVELDASPQAQSRAAPGDCVTIDKPKPSLTYTVQHSVSGGKVTEVRSVWESVTDTGSRVRTNGPSGVIIQVNEHHVADDVIVLDKTTRLNAAGALMDATAFRPGLVGDLAFRACAGRSWEIPSVTATFQSPQTNASSRTPAGAIRILSIQERVTVPAGSFDTVRYVRTSQSTDEYWKSIEHGVIVKHIATLPVGTVTETLLSIR